MKFHGGMVLEAAAAICKDSTIGEGWDLDTIILTVSIFNDYDCRQWFRHQNRNIMGSSLLTKWYRRALVITVRCTTRLTAHRPTTLSVLTPVITGMKNDKSLFSPSGTQQSSTMRKPNDSLVPPPHWWGGDTTIITPTQSTQRHTTWTWWWSWRECTAAHTYPEWLSSDHECAEAWQVTEQLRQTFALQKAPHLELQIPIMFVLLGHSQAQLTWMVAVVYAIDSHLIDTTDWENEIKPSALHTVAKKGL